MMAATPDSVSLRCASVGERATRTALALVTTLGVLYVTGAMPSSRPIQTAASMWHCSAAESAATSGLTALRGEMPDGRTLAALALMTLQLPVIVWLALLAEAALRRRDVWGATLALGLLLLGLLAALGWFSPPVPVRRMPPAVGQGFPACDHGPLC